MKFTFHLRRPFHTPVLSVETDCPEIEKLYRLWEGAYLFPGVPEDSLKAAILREGEGYRLTLEDLVFHTKQPIELLQELYRDRLAIDDAFFPVHGGAVACERSPRGRGALVFAGASGKGKTTLTAYLTLRGYAYLTDDCVLIRKEDFQVVPYPKPIHLRPGGYAVLRAEGLPLPRMEYAALADPRYCYTPACPQEAPLPLLTVFFSAYSAENRMETLRSSDALELLLKCPIYQQKVSAAYLAFLIALLRRAECRLLHYRDFSYIEELLKREGFVNG